MLLIKKQSNENGSHANQSCNFVLPAIPEGWAVVPPELEQQTLELLPWVTLGMEDGEIVGVSDNAEARAAANESAPAPEPDETTLLRAQVTMLQENQTFLENCILEMAEEVYA